MYASLFYAPCLTPGPSPPCGREFPEVPQAAPWTSSHKPAAIDWDALIREVTERGAEVPEVHWRKPGG